jgi:hypothetical protein
LLDEHCRYIVTPTFHLDVEVHLLISSTRVLLLLRHCHFSIHAIVTIFVIVCFESLRGLKYPYMVKRLACMVISGAVGADCLDILQPARLHQSIITEVAC